MSSSPFLDHLKRVATKLENDFPGTDCGIVASAYLGASEAFDLVNREIILMEANHAAALAAKDERIKELQRIIADLLDDIGEDWRYLTYELHERAKAALPQPAAREGGE